MTNFQSIESPSTPLMKIPHFIFPALAFVPLHAAPLLHEPFSSQTAGNLPGQPAANGGFASGASWTGLNSSFGSNVADASTLVAGSGLLWGDLVTAPNFVRVKGDGSNTRVMMDVTPGGSFGSASLLDPNTGTIGGGEVDGTLYLSFLFRATSTNRDSEYGGLQFARTNSDQTGALLGNGWTPWAYSVFVPPSTNLDLKENGGTGVWQDMNNQTRLVVARINFIPNAPDQLTVWVDPDPAFPESAQNLDGIYTGTISGDFSFDRIFLRGGNATRQFEYDEIRMGTTWADVTPLANPPLVLEDERLIARIRADGSIARLQAKRAEVWEDIAFRTDTWRGPAWRVDEGTGATSVPLFRVGDTSTFAGSSNGRSFQITYTLDSNGLHATARAENPSPNSWQPLRASLCLGVNTYMASYPSWNSIYFPTLLRCEPSHFWGYLMNPNGRILSLGCPDPVASWQHHYEPGQHRIFTSSLDLLESLPLPPRHPQGLSSISAGAIKEWKITLFAADSLADVKSKLAPRLEAPIIDASRYTGEPGETITFTIHGGAASATTTPPGGSSTPVSLLPSNNGATIAQITLPATHGMLVFRATGANGSSAEAIVNIRRPWSWVLQKSRTEAINKPQKASSHTESWYGLYSGYLARRHFPEATEDAAIEAKFNELFPLMYSTQTGLPTSWHNRLQNHSAMAGLLADRYLATNDLSSLEKAAALCDFLITKQGTDGAYYNGSSHYTSVIYIAKSILEVSEVEKTLADGNNIWQERYDRHIASARRAIDDLKSRLDNIGTEGQGTYEDGMISCSATQLAQFALLEQDPVKRAEYVAAAEHFMLGHRCLAQLLVPDARMNGATLRFWEGQYDILSSSDNYMNSAHGWSAWRIYGLWYLYQLTGKIEYLRQAMDALGTCSHLIDPTTGELRWSFMPDPRVRVGVFEENPTQPGQGVRNWQTLGEHYFPMISQWWKAPPNTWVTGYWGNDGGSCDNDVHEIFKCLEEVALTSAYVIFHQDGKIETWNCRIEEVGGTKVIKPSETCVSRIHIHTPVSREVSVSFSGKLIKRTINQPGWIEEQAGDNAYHDWRSTHFGSAYATMPSAMDDADADGDGVPTLLEYLLAGRSPLASEPLPLPEQSTDPSFLRIRLDRRPGVEPTAVFQWSQNLHEWSMASSLPDDSIRVLEDASHQEVWLRSARYPQAFFRIVRPSP